MWQIISRLQVPQHIVADIWICQGQGQGQEQGSRAGAGAAEGAGQAGAGRGRNRGRGAKTPKKQFLSRSPRGPKWPTSRPVWGEGPILVPIKTSSGAGRGCYRPHGCGEAGRRIGSLHHRGRGAYAPPTHSRWAAYALSLGFRVSRSGFRVSG